TYRRHFPYFAHERITAVEGRAVLLFFCLRQRLVVAEAAIGCQPYLGGIPRQARNDKMLARESGAFVGRLCQTPPLLDHERDGVSQKRPINAKPLLIAIEIRGTEAAPTFQKGMAFHRNALQ